MKISILGAAGNIGQNVAMLLKTLLPAASILSLYDINKTILGVASDVSHIPSDVRVYGFCDKGISDAIHDSNIIIITAGLPRSPGMKRADLFNINADIILTLVKQISSISPKSMLMIVTNPLNSMVVVAAETLKKYKVYNKNTLFGITYLDIMRTIVFISKMKNLSIKNINVNVVGGHSENTILPLLSEVKNIHFEKEEILNIVNNVRSAGTKIVNMKFGNGSATLSIAHAISNFCMLLVNAILENKTVSSCAYVDNSYENCDRFFARPILINREGICKRQKINLSDGFERESLTKIMKILDRDVILGKSFVKNRIKELDSY